MFIFDRSFMPVAAGLGIALLFVSLDNLSQLPMRSPETTAQSLQSRQPVGHATPRVSPPAVRKDSAPRCAGPAASPSPSEPQTRPDRSLQCVPRAETSTPPTARRSS